MIRTLQEALGEVETYSPAEERLNRRRRTTGLALGPIAFIVVLWLPMASLPVPAHRLAAVVALVAVLWLTEALPLAVTAMLGPILAVLAGVAPARAALAPFADPLVFLLIGIFMLAEAMFVHGLDRRVAYAALASRLVGSNLGRLVFVYAALGAAASMWMSNIATTAMMFPIGLSVVAHFARTAPPGDRSVARFALALMLLTSFAPAVGGLATPSAPPQPDWHQHARPSRGGLGAILPLFAVTLDRRRSSCSCRFHATFLRGPLPSYATTS
jgi:sodium-dependent dicarboxylate transporter 2/3/5